MGDDTGLETDGGGEPRVAHLLRRRARRPRVWTEGSAVHRKRVSHRTSHAPRMHSLAKSRARLVRRTLWQQTRARTHIGGTAS